MRDDLFAALRRRSRPCGVLATIAAGLMLGFSGPADARTGASALSGEYGFQVTWSVFPELVLAKGQAALAEMDEGYEMRVRAQAQMAVPPINWRGLFAVRGDGKLGEGRPTRFERRSTRPEIETTVVVTWPEDGTSGPPQTQSYVRPAGYRIARDPVPEDKVVDVVDPLSFMAKVLRQVADTNGESCDLTMSTWDGARLATIEIKTHETVQAARTDCQVIYRSIEGLRKDTPWRAEEERTFRLLRFVRKGLRWEPQFLRIDGVFLGYESTFTTTFTPLDR